MSDIGVTASSVVASGNAVIARGTSGGAITAGMTVFADTDGLIKPAAQTSATTAAVIGIALNGASANQPVEYATDGDITMTTSPALSTALVYVLGSSGGGISLSADLATNRYGTALGVALSGTVLRLGIVASGVKVP